MNNFNNNFNNNFIEFFLLLFLILKISSSSSATTTSFNKSFLNNKKMWQSAIEKNDFLLLKELKQLKIKMLLKDQEIKSIVFSIKSVEYYETINYLLDFIHLDLNTSFTLLVQTLEILTTPLTLTQQNIQFTIINKLINNQNNITKNITKIDKYIQENFSLFALTLNIPLFDYIMKIYDFNVNEVNSSGFTCIHLLVIYAYNNLKDFTVAFKMIKHLLSKGAIFNRVVREGDDLTYFIQNEIKNQTIITELGRLFGVRFVKNNDKKSLLFKKLSQ